MKNRGTMRWGLLAFSAAIVLALAGWGLAFYVLGRQHAPPSASRPKPPGPLERPLSVTIQAPEKKPTAEHPGKQGDRNAPMALLGGNPQPNVILAPESPTEPLLSAREHIPAASPEYKRLRKLITEALEAYESIKSDVLAGRTDTLVNRLLDNGEPIPQKKAEQLDAEFQSDIGRIKEVFKRLDQHPQIWQGNFTVKMNEAREFITRGGKRPDESATEVVAVSFHLMGSTPVAQAFPFLAKQAQAGWNPTVVSWGLVVVLKRIDGAWYWQPFGW